MEASRAGKDVTVVIELRARFDEEANIQLATRLQEAGIQVVYGVVGFKTHAKMLLVVRREKNRLVKYVHVGTGNYHASDRARLHRREPADQRRRQITDDVHKVFMQLTGLGQALDLKTGRAGTVRAAPLRRRSHRRGDDGSPRPAWRGAPHRPDELARRSGRDRRALRPPRRAGVRVELVVRGICMLRAQVPGLSENIRVVSVLGRFLEHSRVFWFGGGGEEGRACYISSADWMPRNFFSRVEIAVPLSRARRSRASRRNAWMSTSATTPSPGTSPPTAATSAARRGRAGCSARSRR